MENLKEIKVLSGRLKGIARTCASVKNTDYVEIFVVNDYNGIITELANTTQDNLSFLLIPSSEASAMGSGIYRYKGIILKTKLDQAIEFVQAKYEITGGISNLGNVIKSIADPEIKERCLDILGADGNFDRVIREATTILEDRIRKVSGLNSSYYGVKLITEALHHKDGILEIEGEESEREGIYHILRGITLSFRQETHHKICDHFTQDEAMKVMVMIDLLLQIIGRAKKKTKP